MKSTQYSDKVLDHFRNPRNVGTLEGNDVAVGRVGNPVCGDLMEIYIRVIDNRIEDIRFKTFGCGSAIATASMISELAKGKTLDDALKITRENVADELDGLPPIKMHCSNLAADALRKAIKNYQEKKTGKHAEKVVTAGCDEKIPGSAAFNNKGVYRGAIDIGILKDKRTVITACDEHAFELAIGLSKISPRVILITEREETTMDETVRRRLSEAGVKVLYESKIVEAQGLNVLEKLRIHDLKEDEEYELFVDALILPSDRSSEQG